VRLRRHQLETHLTLQGWRPGYNIGNITATPGRRGYLLRNSDRIVTWWHGSENITIDNDDSTPYFLNDRWRFCEWADIPGPQLRRMAELTDDVLKEQNV
jgi:hypothetical protein